MPVLSIVVCRMLEDEIAHLLSSDREIRELILLDGIESIKLSAKLKSLGRPHILLGLQEVTVYLEKESGFSNCQHGLLSRWMARLCPDHRGKSRLVVVVSPIRIGLHISLERLQSAVYEDIRRVAAFSDGILIFYGRCGNSLANLEKDLSNLPCPLYFLNDESGERIDDCIATTLGGNEIYNRTLAEHQDVAVFMTPMWAANWRVLEQEGADHGGNKDMKSILAGSSLTKVARIDTGLSFEKGFDGNVEDFARQFRLEKITLKGGTAVAEKSYLQAKRRLMNCWEMQRGQDASDRSRCIK